MDLFQRRANKTTQLVNNSDEEFFVDGKHRWFKFEFESPVIVQKIIVETEGYGDQSKVSFEFFHVDQSTYGSRVDFSNGSFSVELNKLISGFRFRPDTKFLSLKNQKIKKVVVVGYTPEELANLEEAIHLMDQRAEEIDQKYQGLETKENDTQQKVDEFTEQIEELNQSKADLDNQIGETQKQIEKLERESKASGKKAEEVSSIVADLEAEVNRNRDERRTLADEISKSESQLNRIKQEIGLFPSEIAGFVKEGRRNIWAYLIYASPFAAAILYVTYQLFYSAVDLTHILSNENVDVWTVILTRLPFVVVAVTILQVCGVVVSRLVGEIVQINTQRLNLSKLSIIAKDVANASAADIELTANERFEMETHLKMELLREHMKFYIGENYAYQGGRVGRLVKDWSSRKKEEPSNPDGKEE